MARITRISLFLIGILLIVVAAPAGAQGGLTIIDPADITGFIEKGVGTAATTIYVNNEADRSDEDGIFGTLTITTLLKASSPSGYSASPLCVSVQIGSEIASQCLTTVTMPVTFASGETTRINVTINSVTSTSPSQPLPALQYGEATLITVFNQDTTTGQTPVTEPITLSEYRKLFFVPSLYVPDAMGASGVFSVVILLGALFWLFYHEKERLKERGLRQPLGEITWGTQSWTALLTSLASTIGVVAISGSSAGISLTTFNASVYTTTIASMGILFSVLPIAGTIAYRLLGRLLGNAETKGGNLLGYTVASAFILFALIGSVLISSNVIQMVLLSSLGITDPTMIPLYLGAVTVASAVIIIVIGIYFASHFRSDIAVQLDDEARKAAKKTQADKLLKIVEDAWVTIPPDYAQASAALLVLQAAAQYDVPVPPGTPIPSSRTFRSASAAPKMSI